VSSKVTGRPADPLGKGLLSPRLHNATPVLSVVVISYGRAEDLRACLADLLGQRTSTAFEVVLVLQAYTDAMVASLPSASEGGPDVIVARHDRPLGVYGARNAGIRLARGDVIAFVDDDCRIPPTWVDELLAHYDDPTVGGVGGFAVYPRIGTGLRPLFDMLWGTNPSRYVIDWGGFHAMPYYGQPDGTQDADWLPGCNMSFRRSAIAQVGEFAATYGNYGFDDVDYSLRVRRAGWRLVTSGRLTVEHFPSPVGRDRAEVLAFHEQRCRAHFARRAIGDRALWRLRYAVRQFWHLLLVTQVALYRRHWRVPLAAVRGTLAGLRETRGPTPVV
jgi:GT2 family glycosyltransferase